MGEGAGGGVWLLSESGRGCTLYRWGILSRCFRGLCLCKRCDMVSEGQSWDYRGDICCVPAVELRLYPHQRCVM